MSEHESAQAQIRVLAVDDDESALKILNALLRDAGHKVFLARSGEGGLWSKYDPRMLEIDHFGKAKLNRAHEVLAAREARDLLKVLITQNIDSVQLN